MASESTSAEAFRRASEAFNRLRRMAPAEREAALGSACDGDEDLIRQVRGMLEEHTEAHARSDEAVASDPATLTRLIDASIGVRQTASPIPTEMAGYRILRRIGLGGMGHVYEAEQDEPRRRVAIKVLRQEVGSPDMRARFRREGELLARLQHDGIARVHAVGAENGVPYFVMELIEGVRLDEAVRGKSIEERVALMARVCDAVAYAHRHGVIHRDLKPTNILVSSGGDPKILDFGVARPLEGTQHTAHGDILGTLAYMSPEQLRGEDVDTRADVFALGVLCFEMLSGRRPYDTFEGNPAALLGAMSDTRPPSLARADRSLRGDLSVVVDQAIDPVADRRYGGAEALAEDLRRVLRNDVVLARPPTATYQLRKFVSRHRALVGGSALAVLALLIALIVSVAQMSNAQRARDQARREADAARRAEARAAYQAASVAMHSDEPWLAAGALSSVPPGMRDWAWSHLQARVRPHISEVELPEGKGRYVIRLGAMGLLRLDEKVIPASLALPANAPWSPAAQTAPDLLEAGDCIQAPSQRHAPAGVPRSFSSSPDGVHLQSAGGLETLVEGEHTPEGEWRIRATYRAYMGPGPIALSADRVWVAKGDATGVVSIWRRGTGDIDATRTLHARSPVTTLAFTPEGTALAVGGQDGGIRVLDVATGATLGWGALERNVSSLVFSKSGEFLVASDSERIRSFAWRESESFVLRHHEDGSAPNQGPYVYGLAFSGDGRWIISGGWDGTVRVSDTRTGRLRATLREYWTVRSLAYAPEKQLLAVCGGDVRDRGRGGVLDVWHLPTAERVFRVRGEAAQEGLAFSPDESMLFGLLPGERHGVLDTNTWTPLWEKEHGQFSSAPADVRFLDDERVLVVSGNRHPARVLRARDGHVLHELGQPMNLGVAAAVGPRGRLAIAGWRDGHISLFDDQGTSLGRIETPGGAIHTLAFGPDGRLFSGGSDNQIRIWDPERLEARERLSGHQSYVFQLAFSADATLLASTGGDGSVRLWQTQPAAERWKARRRAQALEKTLWPKLEALLHEVGDREAVRKRVLADATYPAEEQNVLLDRLMELAWKAR